MLAHGQRIQLPDSLLPGLTVEDMKLCVSQIFSPVIARLFRELELVEQWGSGAPGFFQQAREARLPEPVIEETAGRVRLTVRLAQHLPFEGIQSRRRMPCTGSATGSCVTG